MERSGRRVTRRLIPPRSLSGCRNDALIVDQFLYQTLASFYDFGKSTEESCGGGAVDNVMVEGRSDAEMLS